VSSTWKSAGRSFPSPASWSSGRLTYSAIGNSGAWAGFPLIRRLQSSRQTVEPIFRGVWPALSPGISESIACDRGDTDKRPALRVVRGVKTGWSRHTMPGAHQSWFTTADGRAETRFRFLVAALRAYSWADPLRHADADAQAFSPVTAALAVSCPQSLRHRPGARRRRLVMDACRMHLAGSRRTRREQHRE